MRKHFILLAIFLALFPCISFSADRSISCDSPQGTRVDYFLSNTMKIDNEKFVMARDKVEGISIQLLIKENKQDVTLKIQDQSADMKVLLSTNDQITFSGLFNGAPIMATYYPTEKILIYSQQATWPGGDFSGARAMLFYSKCSDVSENTQLNIPTNNAQ